MRTGIKPSVSFTQYAQSSPLFTVREARDLYGRTARSRSIQNMLHRLKRQNRVRLVANGVYSGTLAAVSVNRYHVPRALRKDAVVALHSALELHGVANQTFQTVYYFSRQARKDVIFDGITYHRVTPPRARFGAAEENFQTELVTENARVTRRERTFVDCLVFLDYSGGVEELDQSLAMFPSFDFQAALAYLKRLHRPWLYSRLGFLLDRHADKLVFSGPVRDKFLRKVQPGVAYLAEKRPGSQWVPTWRIMVPATLCSANRESVRT